MFNFLRKYKNFVNGHFKVVNGPLTLGFELISTYTSSVTRCIRRYRCIWRYRRILRVDLTVSLELSDLLSSIFCYKNFHMKQKKIDKDQRILPLTAIAIDRKLWGF